MTGGVHGSQGNRHLQYESSTWFTTAERKRRTEAQPLALASGAFFGDAAEWVEE